jgi:hypothetical protein
MYGQGTGVSSNQSVYLNVSGASNGAAQTGQTIEVGTGSLSGVVLSNASSVSQLVMGGSTAQPLATYTFNVAVAGGVTITELGFTVAATNVVTSVTVGGQTAPVVSGKALVTGLNIAVPVGNSGLDVPVTVNYPSVGTNGVHDQSVTVYLAHIKYLAGSKTTSIGPTNLPFGTSDTAASAVFGGNANGVPAPVMELAGTNVSVTLVPSTSTLGAASNKIGSVTIAAGAGGDVILHQLPLTIGVSSAGANVTGSPDIKDSTNNNDILTQTGGNCVTLGTNVTTGTSNCTFGTGGYTIKAGTSKTFDVYVNMGTGAMGASGTTSVTLGLNGVSNFLWHDVQGAANLNGTYISNFPSTTVAIHN